jgi:hypothetical protein
VGYPTMGVTAKFALGDALPVDKPLEVTTENVRLVQTVQDVGAGGRGTKSVPDARATDGTRTVTGSFTMDGPSPAMLQTILRYLTGSDPVANVYALTDLALLDFFLVKSSAAAVKGFSGCKLSQVTFTSEQGGFLTCVCNVEGKDDAVATMPVLALDAGKPFKHGDLVATIGGTARDVMRVEIVHNNNLALDMFRNSFSRKALAEASRTITVALTAPWTADELDLFSTAAVAVNLTWTRLAKVFTFASPAVRFPVETPSKQGEGEITFPLPAGRCRATAGTNEATYTLVP